MQNNLFGIDLLIIPDFSAPLYVPFIGLNSFDNAIGGCCLTDDVVTITSEHTPSSVSEPGALLLLAIGLAGLGITSRRRAKKATV